MTAEQLALIAGVVLSLVFSYFPKLNEKWAALPSGTKKLIMLGMVVVVGAVSFGLACLGIGAAIGLTLQCTQKDALDLLIAIIFAAIGNQGMYALSPQTNKVEEIKEARPEG